MEIEEKVEEDVGFIFYIWDINEVYFELYQILYNYLNEYYSINAPVLLSLISSEGLEVKKTLTLIPFIHSGCLSVILEKT